MIERVQENVKLMNQGKIKWYSHSHLMPEAGNLLIFNDIECLSPIKLNEP